MGTKLGAWITCSPFHKGGFPHFYLTEEFDEPPVTQGNPSMARARFLAEKAPIDRLKPGHTLELYEGKKKVAMVEIIAHGSLKFRVTC